MEDIYKLSIYCHCDFRGKCSNFSVGIEDIDIHEAMSLGYDPESNRAYDEYDIESTFWIGTAEQIDRAIDRGMLYDIYANTEDIDQLVEDIDNELSHYL